MKNPFFWMAVALLAMTSCTKETTLESNAGRAINFRAAMGTRATEIKLSNLQQFYVTALLPDGIFYFTDAEFNATPVIATDEMGDKLGDIENRSDYVHTSALYWPEDNTELKFWAYAPEKGKLGNLAFSNTEATLENFAPAENIADQQDFILTTTTGSKTAENGNNEANGVQLTFGHKLTQIMVKAKNENPTTKCEIIGVKIGYVPGKGSLTSDGASDTWTPVEGEYADYEVDLSSNPIILNGAADRQEDKEKDLLASVGGSAMLIPHSVKPWQKKSNDPATADSPTNNEMSEEVTGSYLAVNIKVMGTTDENKVLVPAVTKTPATHLWIAVPLNGERYQAENPETAPEPAALNSGSGIGIGVQIKNEWKVGKKYIYTLDFTNGFGYVAPGPAPDPGPGPNPDPYIPGKPVSGDIDILVKKVTGWTETPMGGTIDEPLVEEI